MKEQVIDNLIILLLPFEEIIPIKMFYNQASFEKKLLQYNLLISYYLSGKDSRKEEAVNGIFYML